MSLPQPRPVTLKSPHSLSLLLPLSRPYKTTLCHAAGGKCPRLDAPLTLALTPPVPHPLPQPSSPHNPGLSDQPSPSTLSPKSPHIPTSASVFWRKKTIHCPLISLPHPPPPGSAPVVLCPTQEPPLSASRAGRPGLVLTSLTWWAVSLCASPPPAPPAQTSAPGPALNARCVTPLGRASAQPVAPQSSMAFRSRCPYPAAARPVASLQGQPLLRARVQPLLRPPRDIKHANRGEASPPLLQAPPPLAFRRRGGSGAVPLVLYSMTIRPKTVLHATRPSSTSPCARC